LSRYLPSTGDIAVRAFNSIVAILSR
jgi:hypothetical protein